MEIRIKDYLERLEMDLMAHKLSSNNQELDEEHFRKFFPAMLIRGEYKLVDVTTTSSNAPNATLFMIRYYKVGRGINENMLQVMYITAPENTLLYEFFYKTYYEHKFKNRTEWYLYVKWSRTTIHRKSQ